MAYFKNAEELYNILGRFLKESNSADEVLTKLAEIGKVVQYVYTEPEAKITYFVNKDKIMTFDFGETELKPEILMFMKGDIGQEFFLGKLNMIAAMTRGQIKSKGPIQPLLKLTPLTKSMIERYPVYLKENGFNNLTK